MNLKKLRQRLVMTQKDLAEKMGTTQQTIARWESGKTTLNVDQIRNLCIVLECSAEELLGFEFQPEEWRTSPFSIGKWEMPFGTANLTVAGKMLEFPISEEARDAVASQLDRRRFVSDRVGDRWVHLWTLDNRILLLNPDHLAGLGLISDDVEAMPSFENPEVYSALMEVEQHPDASEVASRCDALFAELGEDGVARLTTNLTVTLADGAEETHYMDEDVASEMFDLLAEPPEAGKPRFVLIGSDGTYMEQFANLKHVAMIEIPTISYYRLVASE